MNNATSEKQWKSRKTQLTNSWAVVSRRTVKDESTHKVLDGVGHMYAATRKVMANAAP